MNALHELPDKNICQTESYDEWSKTLYLCRGSVPVLCRYALCFGFDHYFCTHEDRAALTGTDDPDVVRVRRRDVKGER